MKAAKITSGLLMALVLMLMSLGANAQTSTPFQTPTFTPAPVIVLGADEAEINPDANISFPPPVYLLWDTVPLFGSANVPNMSNYFIESLALADFPDVEEPDAVWLPVTLPSTRPVDDDRLGQWDTRLVSDGLYALRLTVNITGRQHVSHIISPLRVQNEVPDPAREMFVERPVASPTPIVITRPTLAATPTPFSSLPRVNAITDANVRLGDDVSYARVGVLLAGQSADIIGRSPNGWYYIQLPTGGRGFISPTVVTTTGIVEGLAIFQPPATPTPVPTNTPVPAGNLLINGHGIVPEEPRCNEPFQVQVNITNNGRARTSSGGVVQLQDYHNASGTFVTSATQGFPALDPGQNHVVVFNLLITQFPREDHRVVLTVDPQNQIAEENELDNTYTFNYRLRGGTCP